MSNARLTDSELEEALAYAHGMHSLRMTAVVAELRERRRADRDIHRLADVCAEYFERNGTWPLWATEQLVAMLRGKP